MIRQYLMSTGFVYEDDGEVFDPVTPAKDRPRVDWPTADFIIQADPDRAYVYRTWYPSTIRERNLAGFLVDVSQTVASAEPVVAVVEKIPVEPLVIGQQTVLAGIETGVIYRIAQRYDSRFINAASATAARASLGLRYEPYFNQVDVVLSAALGQSTNVYKLTAQAAKDMFTNNV